MKFTQQQLLQAARAVGLGRESFTTAELREQLKVSTKDSQKLNQFYRAFRALQSADESEIEKLGPNCYRLRVRQEERTVEVDPSELSEVSGLTALVHEPALVEDVALVTELATASLECQAETSLLTAECVSEEVAVEGESAETPPAVVPSWRGHVQRLGSRMRSWFGGNAGAAAQA